MSWMVVVVVVVQWWWLVPLHGAEIVVEQWLIATEPRSVSPLGAKTKKTNRHQSGPTK